MNQTDVLLGEKGMKGDTGFPGPEGQVGEKGDPGPWGQDGRDCNNGVPGQKGETGSIGPQGPAGMKGETGSHGPPGDMGLTGLQGPPGPTTGGVTYVRWGRTTCPSTPGTELVYTGRAAGTSYNTQGGTSDYLCLPEQPEYLNFLAGTTGHSPIHGAEYQTEGGPLPTATDQNVPCVVCCTGLRGSLLMIPARLSCPASWTLEYSGYLMTARYDYHRRSAECVDRDAEAIPGLDSNGNGALFYFTEAVCNGISCPPYNNAKELTCTMCTK